MVIGVDASNIRSGGGLTHLIELMAAAEPEAHGISKVVVWAGLKTLERLPRRPWLSADSAVELNGGPAKRLLWQRYALSRVARTRCDLLFIPGGNYQGSFRPFVTMFRNLLPFDAAERWRFFGHATIFRYLLLKRAQTKTFKEASGVIFLNDYGRSVVERVAGGLPAATAVIPHGCAPRFDAPPRMQRRRDECTIDAPFRILYVSIVNFYKHQWHVAEAVGRLRKDGYAVELSMIGAAYKPALRRLRRSMASLDPEGRFIKYADFLPYEQLPHAYQSCDAVIFASSCETFGQILLESMASGSPIACSNRSGLPDLLRDGGLYCDPESPEDIKLTLQRLIDDAALRASLATRAREIAQRYSWRACADQTFSFLQKVYQDSMSGRKM